MFTTFFNFKKEINVIIKNNDKLPFRIIKEGRIH